MATATRNSGRGKRPSLVKAAGGDGAAALNGKHAEAITIGEPVAIAGHDDKQGETRLILLSQLQPSPTNPRKHFADEQLDELSASLKQHGLLEPLVVRPDPNYITGRGKPCYEIVCGERRYRAAQRARLKEVLCRVCYFSDQEVLELQLVENLQRADLTPLEEARAFQALIDAGMTQEKLAAKIGRTQGHVSNRVRLLELPEDLQVDVNAGHLPATQARLIAPYAHVPKIVRAMRQFAHAEAKQNDGQPPSVKEWQHQLSRIVQRNTSALEGYGWRITVTKENRDELQLVPAPYGNGKRAANVALVKRLAGQKKRAREKRDKAAAGSLGSQERKSAQRLRWQRESEQRNRRELELMIWQLAIAKRLQSAGAETHLVQRMFISLSFDGDGLYGIHQKVFPKLKLGTDVWNELERIAASEMTHVMARTLIEGLSDSHLGLQDKTLQSMAGHLGTKGLASAWGDARDSGWLKKNWAREAKDCGHAGDGKEIPLDCPAWLLPPAKKGKK